jgi:hypothetical protein
MLTVSEPPVKMRGNRKVLRSSQTADDTGRRDGHRHGGCERDVLKEEIVGQAVLAGGKEPKPKRSTKGKLVAHYPAFDPTRPVGVVPVLALSSHRLSLPTSLLPQPHRFLDS